MNRTGIKPTVDPIAAQKGAKATKPATTRKKVTKVSKKPCSKQTKPPITDKPVSDKHAGGRPTKYSPDLCAQVLAYFDREPYEVKYRTITRKDGSTIEEEYKDPVELPTLAGFACSLHVHRDTLNEWTRRHPEFSDAIKEAKEHQERILIANGLVGLYESTPFIFVAKNLTTLRDKVEQEVVHMTYEEALRLAQGNK